jgi:hypothetical protein
VTTGEQRLGALLRSAAADDAAWPPTPDLRAEVLARIAAIPAGGTGAVAGVPPQPRERLRPRLMPALVVALLALVVLAGLAAALGLGLPGVTIERVERLPPAGAGLDLGSPVPLEMARNDEPPRILLPAALPEPGTAFVAGAGSRRMVTLAWRAAPGERVLAGTDLRLAIMAVAGRTDEGFLSKLLGPDTTIEPVTVGGDRGWWIAGAPHDLLVLRPDGTADVMATRLAGDTLLFARDGTLYRLESALGRDETIAVAASLR